MPGRLVRNCLKFFSTGLVFGWFCQGGWLAFSYGDGVSPGAGDHLLDGSLHPSTVIACALSAPPQGALLNGLSEIDPWQLPAESQLDLLVVLDRHAAWVASLRAAALAAVAGAEPEPGESDSVFEVDDPVREEVAAALHVSGQAAANQMKVARDLEWKLLGTAELLRAGEISYGHAAVMSDECDRLGLPEARGVEEQVLRAAPGLTPGQLRRKARRAAAKVAPVPAPEQIEAEFARRDVRLFTDGGVMATIEATLPAQDAIAVWNALTASALAGPPPATSCGGTDGSHPAEGMPDHRTMAHKRADALTAWAHRAMNDPGLPTQQGRKRLETHVVIDLPTLLRLADDPAELQGFGPIPAELARDLATDSTWRRLVTDPVTGHLLDYGTATYAPPTALREYLLARDHTCRFPGCTRPAHQSDLDHTRPFPTGSTSALNLHTLCRRHHRLKTHHNWHAEADGAGVLTWTSPRGKTYQTHPPPPLDRPVPTFTRERAATGAELRLAAYLSAA